MRVLRDVCNSSAMPSVISIENTIGSCADGHASDMRALQDGRNPLVM
jgi:hypothetical protein